jgi:predicted RNase H-like nuclease (RuvC/YqgF family)
MSTPSHPNWLDFLTGAGVTGLVAAAIKAVADRLASKESLDARMIEIADSRMRALTESQRTVIAELQEVVKAQAEQITAKNEQIDTLEQSVRKLTTSLRSEKRRNRTLETSIAKMAEMERENAALRAQLVKLQAVIDGAGGFVLKEINNHTHGGAAEALGDQAKTAVLDHVAKGELP